MKKLNLDNTLVILVGKAPEELTLDVVDIHRAKMSGAVNRRAFLWLHLIFHLLSNTQATLHNLRLIYLKDSPHLSPASTAVLQLSLSDSSPPPTCLFSSY